MGRKSYTFRFAKNETNEQKTFVVSAITTDGSETFFTIKQEPATQNSFKWIKASGTYEIDGTTITLYESNSWNSILAYFEINGYTRNDLEVVCDTPNCNGRLIITEWPILSGSIPSNTGETRNITYTIKETSTGNEVAKLVVNQEGKTVSKYFWINSEGTTAYTHQEKLETTATSVSCIALTNYAQSEIITVSNYSWITGVTFSIDGTTGGSFTVNILPNETTQERTGIVKIKHGITTLGTVKITQKGKEKRFKWSTTNSNGIGVEASSTTIIEYYETNNTNLTIVYTDKQNISSATLSNIQGSGYITLNMNSNESTNSVTSRLKIYSNGVEIGWMNVLQNPAATKYFYINAPSATTYSEEYNADEFYNNENPHQINIITNRNDVNFEYGGFLNNVVYVDSPSNDWKHILIMFDENQGIDRVAKITFYTGSTLTTASTIGMISLSQKGVAAKYFYWVSGETSATTLQLIKTAATATSSDVTYITNYTELSLNSEYYGMVVTGFTPSTITNTEGVTKQLQIDFTENISTTMNQTDTIYVKDGNNVVGMINLLQYPKGSINNWFKWVINGENTYNIPGYVSKDGYDIEFEYQTNIEGLSFYSNMLWFEEVPHVKEDGDKCYCKAKLLLNDTEEIRNVVILVKNGTETVGKLTMKQEMTPAEKYIWIVQREQSAVTYDAPYTATSTGYTILTNYTESELNSLRLDKTQNTDWVMNLSLTKTNGLRFNVAKNEDKNNTRNCVISYFNSENVELIRVTINQEANNDKEFKWTSGSITANTATTITSNSGVTDVSVTYETDYTNLSTSVDEQYTWIKNVAIDTTNNAVTYHLDEYSDTSYNPLSGEILLYSGTKLIGRIIVKQEPAPEPDKYFRFKYNGEETEESTLEISNVPATLTDQTRLFTVSALTNYAASVFNLEVDSSLGSGWLTNVNKGNVDTTGFTITFDVGNNTGDERTGYIYLKKNGSVYRTIKVIQREMTYEFSWVQGSIETSKSIGPVGTGATSETVPFYSTYPNITIDNPSQNGISCYMNGTSEVRYSTTQRGATEYDIRSATFNLMSNGRTIGTLTVRQEGQVAPLKFQWDNSTNYKEITIDYNRETLNVAYTREPNDNTYLLGLFADTNNPQGMAGTMFLWSTGVSISINEFSAEASQNRRAVFYIKASDNGAPTMDSPTYGTLVVNQTPKPYFYWGTGTETATTMTIPVTGALGTGQSVTFRTNYTSLTADDVQNNIFLGRSLNLGTKKFSVVANSNETIAEKSQTFKIYNNGNEVGRIAVKQPGSEPTFKWYVNGDTAYTDNRLTYTGGTIEQTFTTNYLNVVLSGTKPSWVTSSSITETFKCTVSSTDNITGNSYTFTVCGQTTTSTSTRRKIGEITVVQAGAPPRFYWTQGTPTGETYTSASTTNTGISSNSISFNTNYSNLSYEIVSDTNSLISSVFVGSTCNITTKSNQTQSQKECVINIISSDISPNQVVGTIWFQQAAPSPYFHWGTTGIQTNSGATIAATATSISTLGISYRTNYTDLSLVLTSGTDFITAYDFGTSYFNITATTNTGSETSREGKYDVYGKWNSVNTNIGTFTLTQSADKVFKWNGSNTATHEIVLEWNDTGISEEYTNTYSLMPTVYSSSTANWISNKSLSSRNGNGTFTATVGTNNTGNDRLVDLYVRTGTTQYSTVGTLKVTQKKQTIADAFSWDSSNHVTATTGTNITTAGTVQTQVYYVTGYSSSNLTVSDNQSWLWCNIDNSKVSYSAQTQSEGASSRTGTITVKNGSTTIGVLTVTQVARPQSWELSVSPTASTVDATGGTVSISVTSNQSWTGSSNQTWATISSTTGNNNGSVTVTVSSSTNTSSRSATITFTGAHGQTASVTITQNEYVEPKYFKWNSNNATAMTVNNVHFLGDNISESFETNYSLSGTYISSTWVTNGSLNTTSFSAEIEANSSTITDRTATVSIRTGSTSTSEVGKLTINQEKRPAAYVVVVGGDNHFTISCLEGDAALVMLKKVDFVCNGITAETINLNEEIDITEENKYYLKNEGDTLFTFNNNPNGAIIEEVLTYTVDNDTRTASTTTTITTSVSNRTFVYHPQDLTFKAYRS